jgi:hypothetical protein
MTPELLKRLVADQQEDETRPSQYVHRTMEAQLNIFPFWKK